MSLDIEATVKEIICTQLEVEPERVHPEASFVDDLKADSLAVVELVLAFEEKFGIEVPDDDIERLRKVKDAISYLHQRLDTKS